MSHGTAAAAATSDQQEHWPAAKLVQASYRDLGSPQHVEDRFVRHLLGPCHREELKSLLQDASRSSRDYSMRVDMFDLIRADPVLGFLVLRYPSTLLPLLESAIVRAQQTICDAANEEGATGDDDSTHYTVKGAAGLNGGSGGATRVHARLIHLPPSCCKPGAALTAQDVGKIVQVSGTVVRTGPVHMYESARTYQCCGCKPSSGGRWGKKGRGGGASSSQQQQAPPHCGKSFLVHADLEQRNNTLSEPQACPGTLPNGEKCMATKFRVVEDGGSVHTDYQEVKIQDSAGSSNHIPRSLLLKLQHDLVDQCQPGDEVAVVGILLAQWPAQSMLEGMECNVSMAMSVHSIRVIAEKGDMHASTQQIGELEQYRKEFSAYWKEPTNVERPIAARDFITKSVCPKLYGMQVVKLALLMTLIGGVTATEGDEQDDQQEDGTFQWTRDEPAQPSTTAYFESNKQEASISSKKVQTRRRDQSHILLVGDPGTGKSQFLRFAAALCPRSVLTTGVGTTSAGLTCAAVREDGGKEFALEAGALVLADKGVCCIDEFGCIREADRTTIHEAMEQQTLSVAKAGIVCKLNCRATIVAVMNPRNCLYDNHASLSINTGLGTPLLSRFDLIFKLVDSSDAERDSNVTTYLLNRAIQGAGFDVAFGETGEEIWTLEKLRAYISIVKDAFHPAMSDEAALLLEKHYEKCRSSQSNTIPVTVRFLESLIRLSQAHARLMYRGTTTLQDAVAVVQIMECSAFAYGGFEGLDSDSYQDILYRDPMAVGFVDDPDLDFVCFEYRLLRRYDMLDSMDPGRRKQAMDATVTNNDTGWSDVQRHQGVSTCEDHYGRDQFDMTQGTKRARYY